MRRLGETTLVPGEGELRILRRLFESPEQERGVVGARRLRKAAPLCSKGTPCHGFAAAVTSGIGEGREIVARNLGERGVETALLGLLQDGRETARRELGRPIQCRRAGAPASGVAVAGAES